MAADDAIRYTIAEARDRFASLVHDAEEVPAIELTRRGKPVAVLVSYGRYRQLTEARRGLWGEYLRFRERVDLAGWDFSDDVFEGLRDSSPGRDSAP